MPASPTAAPIVCALDTSEASRPALLAAIDLAERAGAPLVFATVRPPLADDAYRFATDPEAAERAVIEVAVDKELGAGACARLAPTIHVVRFVDVAGALVEVAEEVGAAALVVGTHGRRGLERFRLGSVAEAIIRTAPCPVLVVPARGDGRMPGPDHPVLVAVDVSDPSAQALEAGRWLAGLYDARVEAVHVHTPRAVPTLVGTASLSAGALSGAAALPTEADVRAFAAQHGAENVDARVVVAAEAAEGLAARVESAGAGAVAMGTHGRRGLANAVLGSVARAALRRLPCPVLIVRPA